MGAPEMDGVRQVSPAEAAGMVAAGACLLDVREKDEWNAVRVPGSRWQPLSGLQETWSKLSDEEEVVVLCAGGVRSHMAARFLQGHGIRAANIAGGLHAWHASGLPLEG